MILFSLFKTLRETCFDCKSSYRSGLTLFFCHSMRLLHHQTQRVIQHMKF